MTTTKFQKNVSLADYSHYKIGGPAKYFIEVSTGDELLAALLEARSLGERVFVLGGGNNLLISDQGFNGVVIRVGMHELTLGEHDMVTVGAGVLVSDFLNFLDEQGLDGWAWAGGLPGTMGGAIWGNAGAYGGETKDSVVSIESIALDGVRHLRSLEECAFGYRTSIFKEQEQRGIKEIIVKATLRLSKGNRVATAEEVTHHINNRKAKHPLEYPNAGSIFKNIPVERLPESVRIQFAEKIKNDPFPVLPTAVLNAAAGLKGFRIGDAMVSEKHSNFIVNVGHATAAEVKAVMVHIKEVIKEKYGVDLEPEVIEVGP